jgi:hypothetical protein
MNVDRARFLLLTTALSAATAIAVSASGCTVVSDKSDGGTVTPPVDNDAATPYDSGTDAYYATDASDASACLTDDGIAPTCEGATNAACGTLCQNYLPNYKKGVSRAIAECLLALPSCEAGVDEGAIANCVQISLAKACPDPSAATFCTPLVTQCGADGGVSNLDQTECQDLIVGLNDTGRTAFTSCVTEGNTTPGYCQADPSSCIDQLE